MFFKAFIICCVFFFVFCGDNFGSGQYRMKELLEVSYSEHLAAINVEPLEFRGLKNYFVMYYKCLKNLVALPSDEFFVNSFQFHIVKRLVLPVSLYSANHFKNVNATIIYLHML